MLPSSGVCTLIVTTPGASMRAANTSGATNAGETPTTLLADDSLPSSLPQPATISAAVINPAPRNVRTSRTGAAYAAEATGGVRLGIRETDPTTTVAGYSNLCGSSDGEVQTMLGAVEADTVDSARAELTSP